MDNIEIVKTCPLGSKCREIKDGKIYECAWLIKLAGQNPQNGENVDEVGCAIAWMPILQVEVANTNRGQTAALESFRNETTERQDTMLGIALQTAINNQYQLEKF